GIVLDDGLSTLHGPRPDARTCPGARSPGPGGSERQLSNRGSPLQHGAARLQTIPELPAKTRLSRSVSGPPVTRRFRRRPQNPNPLMAATAHSYPESPPRVRVEWLLAGTRVAVAASALVALTLDTPAFIPPRLVAAVLIGYLLYGVAVLALGWSPVRFRRGWDVAVHAFDLMVFSLLASMSDVAMSPLFASFTFIVISATLRWRARGTVVSVIIALLAYTALNIFGERLFGLAGFALKTFAVHALYLVVIATVLGYFGAIQ